MNPHAQWPTAFGAWWSALSAGQSWVITLALALVIDSLKIVKPVPLVAKDVLPLIATGNDMGDAL